MRLLNREWGRRHWLPLLFRRDIRLPKIGPVVTFTFDDFPRSAQNVGGRILTRVGLHGTFYASYGLAGTTDVHSGALFRLDDLYRLVDEGHELASHTFHHVSARDWSLAEYVKEALRGRSALRSINGLSVSDNFAYPFGGVTAATKRAVGNMMLSCRSIFRGVNGEVVDLNLLRANPLYGGVEQLSTVRRLLRTTRELRGWLIFYTHDVQDHPSKYGCTPALFESAVRGALENSMRIMTVSKVLSLAGNSRSLAKPPLLSRSQS